MKSHTERTRVEMCQHDTLRGHLLHDALGLVDHLAPEGRDAAGDLQARQRAHRGPGEAVDAVRAHLSAAEADAERTFPSALRDRQKFPSVRPELLSFVL